MPVSSGVMYALYEQAGVLAQRAAQNPSAMRSLSPSHGGGISRPKTEGCQNVFHGHGMKNTRVNQDCSFRRQAEEAIQLNPLDESNMIAGQNDSRIGFNHCGYDWTFNGGKTWGDQVPPFWQFQLLDGHTVGRLQRSDGRVRLARQRVRRRRLLRRRERRERRARHEVERPERRRRSTTRRTRRAAFQEYRDLPVGVVANDAVDFNDKELMTADARRRRARSGTTST